MTAIAKNKEELKRLREDIRSQGILEKAFPDSCIRKIAKKFSIDDFDYLKREIGIAGRAYIFGRFESPTGVTKEDKIAYVQLIKELQSLENSLELFAHGYLSDQMFWGAKTSGDPAFQNIDRPNIKDEFESGEQHLNRLKELLSFLKCGCEQYRIELIGMDKGGPRKNLGLDMFMGNISGYWEIVLKRRFSLDHHKGEGLTEAFQFVKELITRIEPLTDAQIMTAMRSEIKDLRTHRNLLENLDQVIDSIDC